MSYLSAIIRISLCCMVMIGLCGASGCASKRYGDVMPEQRVSRLQPVKRHMPASALGQRIVNTAASQLGRPYRLGGASPRSGFDCSGLIYWAFQQNGITVPRVTLSQARIGAKITANRLQPGDIVVFSSGNSPHGLHTGIYIGGGRFIHSPNSRSRVRVEELHASRYWRQHLIMGRRVVSR